MLAMIRQQMLITQLFLVSVGGIYTRLCVSCTETFSSTKKIVGITTILSRSEHATAQTRELICTKDVLPQVLQRGKIQYTCTYYITLCVYTYYTQCDKLYTHCCTHVDLQCYTYNVIQYT